MQATKELSAASNVTVIVLCILYAALYLLHGTTAGVPQVSELQPGIWFSWQFLCVLVIAVAAQYELHPHQHPDAPASHSAAPFVARRSALITAVTMWLRAFLALLLFGVDLAYLIVRAVPCFQLDCTASPAAQCCAEGTLYGLALVGVLGQAVLALLMLFILARVPWLPRYYVRDPIDIAGPDLHAAPYVAASAADASLVHLFGPSGRAVGLAKQSQA